MKINETAAVIPGRAASKAGLRATGSDARRGAHERVAFDVSRSEWSNRVTQTSDCCFHGRTYAKLPDQ